MFYYIYWEPRIFTQFKCVFSVKIHNFSLGHWFGLKFNWIHWNNDCHFNTLDFVVFFSYWKSAFFLSKNLCNCIWCFWKYLLLRKLGQDLYFPFTWMLLQHSIVPFPHAWWAIKLLTYFALKEKFKTGELLCQKQSLCCAQSQNRNNTTWFMTHTSPTARLRIIITHQLNVNHLNGCFFKNTDIE